MCAVCLGSGVCVQCVGCSVLCAYRCVRRWFLTCLTCSWFSLVCHASWKLHTKMRFSRGRVRCSMCVCLCVFVCVCARAACGSRSGCASLPLPPHTPLLVLSEFPVAVHTCTHKHTPAHTVHAQTNRLPLACVCACTLHIQCLERNRRRKLPTPASALPALPVCMCVCVCVRARAG